MKKTKRAVIATLMAAMLSTTALGLAACSKADVPDGEGGGGDGSTHAVTFNVNGGKWSDGSTDNKVVTTDAEGKIATADFPANPTREDYVFAGWYANADGTGTTYTLVSLFDSDTTVYAKWTEDQSGGGGGENNTTFTITLNANGGTLAGGITSVTTGTDGKLTSMPSAPTRDEYTFAGWYTTASGGDRITLETKFTANGTIFAHWDPVGQGGPIIPTTYTVTLDAHGGVVAGGLTTVTTGTDGRLTSLPVATKTGFTLNGWYTAATGGDKITTETVFTNNTTTIHAQWTENVVVASGHDLLVNGKLVANMSAGNGPTGVDPEDWVFDYYTSVTLNKDDVVSFDIDGCTIEKIWAEKSTAIVGVTETDGCDIDGDSVTVLAGGTFTVSVVQYTNDVSVGKVVVYVGPYDGPWDGNGDDPIIPGDREVVTDDKAFMVGVINGSTGGDSDWGNGYAMTYDEAETEYDQWKIELDLKADDTVKIRYGGEWYGFSNVEVGGAKDKFEGDDQDNIKVNVAGKYTFYFKPTWGDDQKIYIAGNGGGGGNQGGDKPVDPTPGTGAKMSVGGVANSKEFTHKTSGLDTENKQDDEYYATGVTLSADAVLSFTVDGTAIKLWPDGFDDANVAVGVGEQGPYTSVSVAKADTYTVVIKHYSDNDADVWVVAVVSETSDPGTDPKPTPNPEDDRVAVTADKAYMVGKFAGDANFVSEMGYLMTYDAAAHNNSGEWWIEKSLKAGEVIKFRHNSTWSGYSDTEKCDAKANFEGDGDDNLVVKVAGLYKFYFKPTWGAGNRIYIEESADLTGKDTITQKITLNLSGATNITINVTMPKDLTVQGIYAWSGSANSGWDASAKNLSNNSLTLSSISASGCNIILRMSDGKQTEDIEGLTFTTGGTINLTISGLSGSKYTVKKG
ncbi:MAG: InlB B-repeat-containing protein [Clostridiales bacterium]|nr:InlB B-repeat-containing protein [Clostridiales bacterium]